MDSDSQDSEKHVYDELISKKVEIPQQVLQKGKYSKEDIEDIDKIDKAGDLKVRNTSRDVIAYGIKAMGLGIAISVFMFFAYVTVLGGVYVHHIYADVERIEVVLIAFLKYGLAIALGFLVNNVWGNLHKYK
uniref:Uncharacterized protein n=1 Tax=Candidatus Kentrum sp. FW TaxID=2126338 RepID=A0A450TVL6_9GAMM|nr:MAG: hypothetical protein BECKFW1821C_GA0114237_10412 [Candidatus Kentron sp. FW]